MREYILSITAVTLIGSILLSMLSDGPMKQSLRLVCGILLTITVLRPLSEFKLPNMGSEWMRYQEIARAQAAEGEAMASEERRSRICQSLEAYILDKAGITDTEISIDLRLTHTDIPQSIEIIGDLTDQQRKIAQTIITNDLGIPEEDQTWSTKREEDGWPTSSENTAGQRRLP